MEQFDVLRREATKLERSLEDKIARYHQLAQRLTSGSMESKNSLLDSHNTAAHQRLSPSTPSKTTSSTNTFSEEEEANLSKEINRSLNLLSDLINTKMAPAAQRTNSSQHSLLVKRYREILFDSTADFQKTAQGLSRRREQLQLFRGAAAAIQDPGGGTGRMVWLVMRSSVMLTGQNIILRFPSNSKKKLKSFAKMQWYLSHLRQRK